MTITVDSINETLADYPAIRDWLMNAASHIAECRIRCNETYNTKPSAPSKYFSAQDVANEIYKELQSNNTLYEELLTLPGVGCVINRLANLLEIPAPTGEDYTCAWVDCTTCHQVVLSPVILALSSDIFLRDITD